MARPIPMMQMLQPVLRTEFTRGSRAGLATDRTVTKMVVSPPFRVLAKVEQGVQWMVAEAENLSASNRSTINQWMQIAPEPEGQHPRFLCMLACAELKSLNALFGSHC